MTTNAQTTSLEAMDGWLLLPKLRVQNANAISSPHTWGFPAPSAFLGFVHALQRKLNQQVPLQLLGCAIVAHQFEPQVSQGDRYNPHTFALTRNPTNKKGEPSPIVEEGRCHLTVSLLIPVAGWYEHTANDDEEVELCGQISNHLYTMRCAGGSIISTKGKTRWLSKGENDDQARNALRQIKQRLLPGFALVSRPDYLEDRLKQCRATNPVATTLDVVLDTAALTYQFQAEPETAEEQNKPTQNTGEWIISRKPGWLVPIPVGYQGISPLYAADEVKNSRDTNSPFQYTETILGIGQWVSPHRINNLKTLVWHHHYDASQALYLSANHYSQSI